MSDGLVLLAAWGQLALLVIVLLVLVSRPARR
jgi:hypothetical protein